MSLDETVTKVYKCVTLSPQSISTKEERCTNVACKFSILVSKSVVHCESGRPKVAAKYIIELHLEIASILLAKDVVLGDCR